jgi:hypothetical protein
VEAGLVDHFVDSERADAADEIGEMIKKFPKNIRDFLLGNEPSEWLVEGSQLFLRKLGAILWLHLCLDVDTCASDSDSEFEPLDR